LKNLKKSQVLEQLQLLKADGKKETLSSICIGTLASPTMQYFSLTDSQTFADESVQAIATIDPVCIVTHNGLAYDNKKLESLSDSHFGLLRTKYTASIRGASMSIYRQQGVDEFDTCGFSRNVFRGMLNHRLSTVATRVTKTPIQKSLDYQTLNVLSQQASQGDAQAKEQVRSYALDDIKYTKYIAQKLYPLAVSFAIDTQNPLARLSSSSLSTIATDWYAKLYETAIHRPFFGTTIQVSIDKKLQVLSEFDSRELVKRHVTCSTRGQLTQGHMYVCHPYYYAIAQLTKTFFPTVSRFVQENPDELHALVARELVDAFGVLPVFYAHRYAQHEFPNTSEYVQRVVRQKTRNQLKMQSEKVFQLLTSFPQGYSGKKVLTQFGEALTQIKNASSQGDGLYFDGRFLLTRKPLASLPGCAKYLGCAHALLLSGSQAIWSCEHTVYKSGFSDISSTKVQLSELEKECFDSLVSQKSLSAVEQAKILHTAVQQVYAGTSRAILQKYLNKEPSQYKKKASWVLLAKHQQLHQGDTVSYRTNIDEQIRDIVGVTVDGRILNTNATLFLCAKSVLQSQSSTYIRSFFTKPFSADYVQPSQMSLL
jgi:hypothetical protein